MKRTVIGMAALAFTALLMAGAADVAEPGNDLKHETRAATTSNLTDTAIPQLAPYLKVGPEVPLERETNAAANRGAQTAQPPARPQNTLWIILAVLVLLLGGPLLKRLRSRSDPS
jgi:hypothetical protein